MRSAVIVSTARTPIGRAFRGAFNDTQAQTLAGHAIAEAVKRAGIDPKGAWYVSTGQGMGPVLTMSGELGGYALTDRATYAAYRDRTGLQVLFEGDQRMFNPYGVIVVNPQRYPKLNHAGAMAFADWITSAEGQAAVAAFKINGVQMFFPSAAK